MVGVGTGIGVGFFELKSDPIHDSRLFTDTVGWAMIAFYSGLAVMCSVKWSRGIWGEFCDWATSIFTLDPTVARRGTTEACQTKGPVK